MEKLRLPMSDGPLLFCEACIPEDFLRSADAVEWSAHEGPSVSWWWNIEVTHDASGCTKCRRKDRSSRDHNIGFRDAWLWTSKNLFHRSRRFVWGMRVIWSYNQVLHCGTKKHNSAEKAMSILGTQFGNPFSSEEPTKITFRLFWRSRNSSNISPNSMRLRSAQGCAYQ